MNTRNNTLNLDVISKNEISVTRAIPGDADTLSGISYMAKSHWGYPKEWLDRWSQDLVISPDYILANAVYKLLTDKLTIGFCAIENKIECSEITHLWILPDFMDKGLGKFLLNESLQRSVKSNTLIRVESDPNATGFYQKQGFKIISKVESYPPGRYLPVLERLL